MKPPEFRYAHPKLELGPASGRGSDAFGEFTECALSAMRRLWLAVRIGAMNVGTASEG